MFCKLPRTAWSAHLSLLPASSFRHLLSLLLNRATKRPVTDLTGKTQAVFSPSTVKRFLEANKLPHKEVHHATLTLTCPLCESSQTVFINKTTGGLVCPPCKVHGELVRLGEPSAWSGCILMHVCAYVCVYMCVCVEHNCELATATSFITAPTPPTAVSQFEVVSPVLPVSPGRQIDWTVDS